MTVLTHPDTIVLWQDVVKHAENRCAIILKKELEAYLASLLMRYTTHPEIVKQVFATAFLKASQLGGQERAVSLQHVGDQCLLCVGLFPRIAEKRHVNLRYFVDLGRTAYSAISKKTNDLFSSLAVQFVVLMDVLQSIRPQSDLLPLEAYEQWNELNSRRALRLLQEYAVGLPLKR